MWKEDGKILSQYFAQIYLKNESMSGIETEWKLRIFFSLSNEGEEKKSILKDVFSVLQNKER